MTALYAVMQFIFAPMPGALSDRLGRRPVLLVLRLRFNKPAAPAPMLLQSMR